MRYHFSVSSEPILRVEDLCISFADRPAVKNISFEICPGETLGLVGESGSGKSITSLAVLGLLPAAAHVSGSIHFNGRNLLTEHHLRSLRGREIAMIFQEPMTALNPVMPV